MARWIDKDGKPIENGDRVSVDGREGLVSYRFTKKDGEAVGVKFDGTTRNTAVLASQVSVIGAVAVTADDEDLDDERVEELARQRAAVRRNHSIPYDQIKEAVDAAWLRHPDADEIKGLIHNKEPYVEVWKNGRAAVEFDR